MKFRGSIRQIALSALVLGAAGALSGCIVAGGGYHDDGYYGRGDYPPVHPNNGYRYAYPGGVTLIFDSGLGMYGVYGYPDYYFHQGYFYRWQSGYWNRSRYWDRSWSRCDSRHWPRPVYYVNNNYYGKGRRPQHDWDRGGHNDGDHHGDREDDGVRPIPGGSRGDLAGRGDSADRDAEHEAARRDDGDVNGDGQRERGDRFIDAVRDQEQRGREQEVRERTREQNPSDAQRQPDGEFRRGDRGRGEQTAARPQPAERVTAERPTSEQRASADRNTERRADHAERQATEQAQRDERRTADQAEHAQRQEAVHRKDAERQRDDSSNSDDGGEPDGEAGGARGDNWRSDRR